MDLFDFSSSYIWHSHFIVYVWEDIYPISHQVTFGIESFDNVCGEIFIRLLTKLDLS